MITRSYIINETAAAHIDALAILSSIGKSDLVTDLAFLGVWLMSSTGLDPALTMKAIDAKRRENKEWS